MKTFKQLCDEGYVSHAQRKAVWASRNEKDKKEEKEGPCWKDYEMIGMKTKNGKKVPNCVPK